ncbi:MAG: DUF4968 domain-containing protein, partial [Odoribacter sp.]|nr:DUF4968 domain-containing protein [Odoribacter sp.]
MLVFLFTFLLVHSFAQTGQQTEYTEKTTQRPVTILGAKKINPTTVEISLSNHKTLTLDFYGENIFRAFQDNEGGIIRNPQATPEAQILVEQPRKEVSRLEINDTSGQITITTAKIKIELDKKSTLFKVTDLATGQVALEESSPVQFES